MSRFAVNMTPIGKSYNELLKVLYNGPSAKSFKQELLKYQKVGERVGEMVRVAFSFDLFDRMSGKYAELLTNDEDFD